MATLTIKEPDKEPRTIPLGPEPLIIGRSQSRCTLTFDFLGLSAKHCEIVPVGETFKLVDLDSANHTFVNNKEIVEHYLNHGDRIALGVIILTFNNEGQKQPPPRAGAKPRSSTNAPGVAQNFDAPSDTYKQPTFIMDGEKLRKKMDMLRSGKIESLKDVPATEEGGPKHAVGGTAKDYAKAAETEVPKTHTDFRWLFFALGFFLAMALAFSLGMWFRVLKF